MHILGADRQCFILLYAFLKSNFIASLEILLYTLIYANILASLTLMEAAFQWQCSRILIDISCISVHIICMKIRIRKHTLTKCLFSYNILITTLMNVRHDVSS